MQKLPKGKNINSENARTVMEDQYGFSISDVSGKMIETDSATSYTLLIKRENQSAEFFENLVINIANNDSTSAAILKYNLTSPIIASAHNSYHYSAELELLPILYNAEQVSSRSTTVCYTISEMWCNANVPGLPTPHVANPDCTKKFHFDA